MSRVMDQDPVIYVQIYNKMTNGLSSHELPETPVMCLLSHYYHLPLDSCHRQVLLNQVPISTPIHRSVVDVTHFEHRIGDPMVIQQIITQTQVCQQIYSVLQHYIRIPTKTQSHLVLHQDLPRIIRTIAINTMLNLTLSIGLDELAVKRMTKRHKCWYYFSVGTILGAVFDRFQHQWVLTSCLTLCVDHLKRVYTIIPVIHDRSKMVSGVSDLEIQRQYGHQETHDLVCVYRWNLPISHRT